MSGTQDRAGRGADTPPVLLVGGSAAFAGQLAERVGRVSRCSLTDLDAALAAGPDVVATPWVDGAMDCLDVAAALTALDWDGRLLIVAPPLPRIEILRAEVALQAPMIEVEILTL